MNTQKGFASILLILLGLVVIGGGVYVYDQKNNFNIFNKNERVLQTVGNDDLNEEGWIQDPKMDKNLKKYEDKEIGLSFSYPSEFVVNENNDNTDDEFTRSIKKFYVQFPKRPYEGGIGHTIYFSVSKILKENTKPPTDIVSSQTKKIGNYVWKEEITKQYYLDTYMGDSITYSLVDNSILYIVSFDDLSKISRTDYEFSLYMEAQKEIMNSIILDSQKAVSTYDAKLNYMELVKQAILNGNYYNLITDEFSQFTDGKYYFKYGGGKGEPELVSDYPNDSYSISIHKENIALGNFENNVIHNAAIITGTSFGGSGYFYDLVILQNTSERPDVKPIFQSIDKISLGDRQTILSLKIEGDLIKIEYITQGYGEALCCGTKHVSRTFEIVGGKVTEK